MRMDEKKRLDKQTAQSIYIQIELYIGYSPMLPPTELTAFVRTFNLPPEIDRCYRRPGVYVSVGRRLG